MYKSSYFTEENKAKVIAFMQEYSFAIITCVGEQYPVAAYIPLEIEVKENKIFLSGHLAKNTEHHKAFIKNQNVLVMFNGPHCYVSASWYSTPEMASTWNYMTVHAKGKITFTDDKETYNAIKAITNKYEGTETVAAFDKLSDEYIQHMLKAIIGFSIEVESIENVFKLSQNRDSASQQNIIEQLIKRGDEQSAAIAKEMKQRLQ
jgi:transcriptional regulator